MNRQEWIKHIEKYYDSDNVLFIYNKEALELLGLLRDEDRKKALFTCDVCSMIADRTDLPCDNCANEMFTKYVCTGDNN